MKFASRQDAGRQLARSLFKRHVAADIVLGLPRGGVVIAAEIAREFQLPLDVLVVRKIGHPFQREFAIGALAEPEVVILDEASLSKFPAERYRVDNVIAEETERLREYRLRFRRFNAPVLKDKNVLLVDDGLATGATMEAAIFSAKQQNAKRIIVAAPVSSTDAYEKLRRIADEMVVLMVDSDFEAVGQYYDDFDQASDQSVVVLLRQTAA